MINLADATLDELEGLAQACEPASFGLNKEDVSDETYRNAGKIDLEGFSSTLDLAQTDLIKIIRDYLREGKRSIFKPHVDTPRSKKIFGSLVIVFLARHEGGAMSLRDRGNEWAIDSGWELADVCQPSIGYVAFLSDIEHEVAPVISCHRVAMTYDIQPLLCKAFEALPENPEFLADGGMLIFGLRHIYPIKDDLKPVYSALKGSDAMVYQSVHALGFEPVLHMDYQWDDEVLGVFGGALINKVIRFDDMYLRVGEEVDLTSRLREEGGIIVHEEYQGLDEEDQGLDEEDQESDEEEQGSNQKDQMSSQEDQESDEEDQGLDEEDQQEDTRLDKEDQGWYKNFADEELDPVV
ncbi:hypothetical protein BJV74DRAFT_954321 [Russula compacta]|nr:hypothetical protein BJV74DRAFT_954321 [Russula compacta]